MKRRKLFWQMLLYFVVMVILLSSVTTYLLYKENSEVYEKERKQHQRIVLEQAKKRLDTRIQVGFNALMQLQNSEDFKEYTRANQKTDYYYQQLQLLKQLKSNNSAFASFEYEIGVLNLADDIVVTQDGTKNKGMFFNQLGFSGGNYKELAQYVQQTAPRYDNHEVLILSNTSDDKQSDYLTLVKKDTNGQGREILFLVSFYMRDFFPLVEGKEKGGFALLTKEGVKYVQTNLHLDQVHTILNARELKAIPNYDFQSSYILKETSGVDILSMESEILRNLKYAYFMHKPEALSVMQDVFLKSIIIGLALFAVGLVLASFLVRKTYQPIQHILQHLSKYEQYDGNGELSFIKNTTDQMRKMNEIMQEQMDQSTLSLKQQFLNQLLWGPMDQHVFEEKINLYTIHGAEEQLTVIIMARETNAVHLETLSKEGAWTIKHQVFQFLREKIEPSTFYELFEYGYDEIILILNQTEQEKIVDQLSQLLETMNLELQVNMIAAIGQPVKGLAFIYQSFESAKQILENKFALDKNTILSYEDFSYLNQTNFYYPLEVEKSLIQLVVQGDEERARDILNRVLVENLHAKKLTKNALSQFIFAIRGTINRILQVANKTSKEVFCADISDFHLELQNIYDKKQLEERMVWIFSVLLQKVVTVESKEEMSMATKLLTYIHLNFKKDISLTNLADEFGLSASYVSTIFKSHTGENYKDYLNKYRILKAQEILALQEVKIKELATMVGFNNVNTFIRTFKKYVGLPPGQYEKNK